ncbi:NAD(P)H-dependent FMN reductase [Micromonospora pisi]|uniref:NAD(P)H-dependent FMN reductase n=1 Tax=Micromonospora pisi TaxID=589240 RepID=A0A495JDT0_9ACTN|nr:NAD(P)H-dependent oxidoreductase [Micromonospora pisi]RKR86891.1 NAD(P)H-dependent FMN reductase [Micromonospora pisi]
MSDDDLLRVAVIVGSTRNGRFGPSVAAWFVSRACRRTTLDIDLIDLAKVRLPDVLTDQEEPVPAPVLALAPRLAAADAFVIVTPEYNRSFPAPLKTAVDWYAEEWRAKPVAVVSYGGPSGGLHATSQLREVFTELHAITIRDSVSLPEYWNDFDADGTWPKPSADCHTALNAMLDQLTWWARGLRAARRAHPYVV